MSTLARRVIERARAEGVAFLGPTWIQRKFSCGSAAAQLALEELLSSRDVGRYQRGRGYPVTDPPKEEAMPTHIDDWIEQPPTSEGERLAKDWLDEFRKPAHMADHVWLESVSLTCLYEGERYRCVGASRMGDVWLSPNLSSPIGYELRADVDGCSDWERSDAESPRAARPTRGGELLAIARDLVAYYDDTKGAPNVFDTIDRLRGVVAAADGGKVPS